MIELRNARWAVAMAAGAVLVAGCGSEHDSAEHSKSAAPSTPREQLVLTQEEFPAGTKKLDLPPEQLQSTVGDLTATQQNATFTPAECGSTQQDLGAVTKELLAQSSIAAATGKSGQIFVEFVSGRTGDLQRIADGNKRCGSVEVVASYDGHQVTAKERVTDQAVPQELKGANAIAYHATSTATTDASDKPLTQNAYLGYAEVRGITVAVRVAALDDSLDQAAFDQFFVAAVQKVTKAA
ncbi:hypothetical protein [Nocardia anaemiae]|uniref:hypothetical protein n=1 Tax=Nocardia anaemiae TaxID=263910 RepID=UPI0012F51D73|nr:hypothetical protein [Nocardia anaemiae]